MPIRRSEDKMVFFIYFFYPFFGICGCLNLLSQHKTQKNREKLTKDFMAIARAVVSSTAESRAQAVFIVGAEVGGAWG